jgi:predicted RNA binding protein YcfA (HicA-like mRNA interferase family)
MTNTPSLNGRKMIKSLQRLGFEVIRIKGSHHFVRHPDGRSTVIPVHGNETIGTGLFHKIIKDCELTISEFLDKP